MLLPAHQTVVHECVVDRVTRDCVVLRMSHITVEAWSVTAQYCTPLSLPWYYGQPDTEQCLPHSLVPTRDQLENGGRCETGTVPELPRQ